MLLQHQGEYATFAQWQKLGGHVRKGAKSEIVVFWKIQPIEEEKEDGNNAYYSPKRDLIHLPLFEQFTDANEYYSTAFHKSIHSTMKESRCNRTEDRKEKLVAFGSDEYSKAKLVAEIGSASLMNIIGIETTRSFKNSSAYIQGWLSVLKNDVKFIVSASSKAKKRSSIYQANRDYR